MFSICLNGALIVEGGPMMSGWIVRTNLQRAMPLLRASWKEPEASGSPSTASIHSRASASICGLYLAAAFSASLR